MIAVTRSACPPRPVLIALVATALLAVPADEAPAASVQTKRLCTGSSVPCSIQVDPVWHEGRSREVVVTGRPDVEVGVRAFRAILRGGGVVALEPIGPVAKVTTDGNGFGVTDLRLPLVADDESGGPLLVALADRSGTAFASTLGTWSTLASRRPLVLGDGFGASKPVGERLRLHLAAALPGTVFDVELERDGRWVSVSGEPRACGRDADPCVVEYELPRGLPARPHAVRLINTSTGTPVAAWNARPSNDGTLADRLDVSALPAVGAAVAGAVNGAAGATSNPVPRPRSRGLDVPDIASKVKGASEPKRHSPVVVSRASALLAGLAVVVVALGAVAGSRRREIVLKAR